MAASPVPPERSERGSPADRTLLPTALVFAAGVLAVAVGAGLGVRHLQLEGTTGRAIVGLSVLVAGLILLVAAGRLLWRRVRGRRRLWFLPVLMVSLVAVWSVMFAVMATVVPSTPLDRRGVGPSVTSYRDVRLTTDDGVELSAWWAPSAHGAAVVLLHGAGENRSSTLAAASVLVRHGYGVLLLDARGHGDSSGAGMDLGWYGDSDIGAAIGFLRDESTVDLSRIGVLGLSMGGEEAIGAAAAHPEIRAVVAEGATSRTAEDKAAWLPGGIAGAAQRVIDRVTYGLVDALTPTGPPISLRDAVFRARDTRLLLIAAGSSRDEQDAAAAIRSVASDRISVWTVSGATHTGGLRAAPTEWENRVIAFLDDTLTTA